MAHRYTPIEIMQKLPRERETLRKDFADAEWMPQLDAMLGELYDLAAAATDPDLARLDDLERRVAAFIREREFKGLKPTQVMIESLKARAVKQS